MNNVIMQFGNIEKENATISGFELIENGYLTGENNDETVIDLSAHQLYILFTREITVSSGAVRGFRARLLARTENDGTIQTGNMFASSNAGVNITMNSDETITIKPSSTAYDVYYALYAVM